MCLIQRVTVFCASSRSLSRAYHEIAGELGRLIAGAGWELVFGGGSIGLMGSLARAAHRAGGKVRGVILQRFVDAGIALEEVTEMEVVEDLRPRKTRMEELGDAFVALPGSIGTLEELMEIIARKQIGFHSKPIILLNSRGFYDPLLLFFDRIQGEGFLYRDFLNLFQVAGNPEEVMKLLQDQG